ncbi:MAG: YCF48-related protein [Candidatus Krumholzibacteria bacterium]|nr:YCF48-related protein [Candidatus Krumholzibacteria bacterium]
MQLRRSILLAICIILFVYFEIHSCSKDEIAAPKSATPVESIICGATDVYFQDSDFGCVAGTLGTLMVTVDGGKTWKGTVIDGGSLNDLQFIGRSNGWVVGKDGAIYRTGDGGGEWAKVAASGLPIAEDFFKLAFFNENLGYVLGYGGVYKTENAGGTWVNNWLPVVPYRGAWDMSFADDRTGYLLGSRYTDPDPSILYRTTNGGASWTSVAGSKASILRTVLAICFVDGMTGWAGGGVIMKTTDGGESWTTQVPIATVREFCFLSDTHGFAAGGKTILRTKDGGQIWENVTPTDNRIKDLRSVYFLDAENGWVAGRGADEQVGDVYLKHSILLRTNDGGTTWTIMDFAYDFTALQGLQESADQ